NHFERFYNPFLAFAARCTSSFPVAFEPMRLKDIDAAVHDVYSDVVEDRRASLLSASPAWRDFFLEYLTPRARSRRLGEARGGADDGGGDPAQDFAARAFADGGDLDNKPFGYAIDTLLRRRSELPVVRKLVFVDPDPQSPLDAADRARDVDVLQNTLFALSPSVSTETIREDIQRIGERNRLIERIRHFVDGAEDDVRWRKQSKQREGKSDAATKPAGRDDDAKDYATRYMEGMVAEYGTGYGGYHRVKVAALTDDLARIIVRAANLGEDSDEFAAVRDLVRAWRDQTYSLSAEESGGGAKPPQSRFLLDFDLDYRLRRLGFLRSKIDELTCADDAALKNKLREVFGDSPAAGLSARRGFLGDFRAALHRVRRLEFSGATEPLLLAQAPYQRRGTANPLRGKKGVAGEAGADLLDPERTGVTVAALRQLLLSASGESRAAAASAMVREGTPARAALDAIAGRLAGRFKGEFNRDAEGDFKRAIIESSHKCGELFGAMGAPPPAADAPAADWARALLRHYYDDYHLFDQVIFPVMYETGVGEIGAVDVVRVSPYDAFSLIDELKTDMEERDGGRGRRKLGGTALGHFGAFLKREWRTNDILWGRLDAAETLIRTLLPVEGEPVGSMSGEERARKDQRDALIKEAQEEILKEELLDEERRDDVRREVIQLLLKASSVPAHAALEEVKRQLAKSPLGKGTVLDFFESCADPSKLVGYFKDPKGYEVDRSLDPREVVQLMARSSRVFGGMLESLAERRRVAERRAAWVTRLAQVFWGVVQVAVPGSFPNLLFKHFVKLLYAFEAFLIVGGVLLVDANIQRFGLVALAVTAGTHIVVRALGDYMSNKPFLRGLVVVPASLVGGALLLSVWSSLDKLREVWVKVSDYLAGLPLLSRLHPLPAEARALIFFAALALVVATVAWALGGGWAAVKRTFPPPDEPAPTGEPTGEASAPTRR
ncbi:MAG: patatin-like protein, partial [Acidobacteria bacterium]|nr:patatin-like protein [Acidobacteriota bacterium]